MLETLEQKPGYVEWLGCAGVTAKNHTELPMSLQGWTLFSKRYVSILACNDISVTVLSNTNNYMTFTGFLWADYTMANHITILFDCVYACRDVVWLLRVIIITSLWNLVSVKSCQKGHFWSLFRPCLSTSQVVKGYNVCGKHCLLKLLFVQRCCAGIFFFFSLKYLL